MEKARVFLDRCRSFSPSEIFKQRLESLTRPDAYMAMENQVHYEYHLRNYRMVKPEALLQVITIEKEKMLEKDGNEKHIIPFIMDTKRQLVSYISCRKEEIDRLKSILAQSGYRADDMISLQHALGNFFSRIFTEQEYCITVIDEKDMYVSLISQGKFLYSIRSQCRKNLLGCHELQLEAARKAAREAEIPWEKVQLHTYHMGTNPDTYQEMKGTSLHLLLKKHQHHYEARQLLSWQEAYRSN